MASVPEAPAATTASGEPRMPPPPCFSANENVDGWVGGWMCPSERETGIDVYEIQIEIIANNSGRAEMVHAMQI